MKQEPDAAWNDWLSGLPEAARALAKRFGPGTPLDTHAGLVYVVGYGELSEGSATLLVSNVDPSVDYERAVDSRQPVCVCCLARVLGIE